MARKKQTIYRSNELVMKSTRPTTAVAQDLDEICKTRPMTSPISRRMFFALSASVVVVACSKNESSTEPAPDSSAASTSVAPTTSPVPQTDLTSDPFTLGVASGDPTDQSVILWTRLAVDSLNGGGMRTVLSIGLTGPDTVVDADAVVVALKSRSIDPAQAVAQSVDALGWLRARGAPR